MALLAGFHMLLVRAAAGVFVRAGFARAGGVLVALLAGLNVLLVRAAAGEFVRTGFARARRILVALLARLDVLFVRSTLIGCHYVSPILVDPSPTGAMTVCSGFHQQEDVCVGLSATAFTRPPRWLLRVRFRSSGAPE